ncbi:hypothetical protein [Pseudonocardia phyllosphaerae]|uniref:hypothetical protein n=1 Tax=Pseudonocardia phyllosphaerae TaxID=3390502 RepID=UPI0039780C93
MQLDGYVDRLRAQFAAVSDVASDEVRDIAERLVAPLESTVRLVLLEALATAADEITLDLAPGSVHLRLSGSDPEFVVAPAPTGSTAPDATPSGATVAPPPESEGGPVARINFRPPESLKTRIEDAAGRDGLSVNTWLTRVAQAALDQPSSSAPPGNRRVGWFG